MRLPRFLQGIFGGRTDKTQQVSQLPLTLQTESSSASEKPTVEVDGFDILQVKKKHNEHHTMTKAQRKARAWRRLYAGGSS